MRTIKFLIFFSVTIFEFEKVEVPKYSNQNHRPILRSAIKTNLRLRNKLFHFNQGNHPPAGPRSSELQCSHRFISEIL